MSLTKTQIIKCKCGKTFASCIEPYCYEDKDWQKEMRQYIKKGCTVETIYLIDLSMEKCACKQEVIANQISIF